MGILVGGRFLQGMGGGMLLTLYYVAVESWFAPKLWGRLFAIVALIWGGGSLLGPLIGAAFAGPHTWRGAFWSFAAQAAILAAVATATLPDSAARKKNAVQNKASERSKGCPNSKASLNNKRRNEKWPVLPLMVLSIATLVIAESGATSTPPATRCVGASGATTTGVTHAGITTPGAATACATSGHLALPILGCLAGLGLLYLAARLDRRSPVRMLPVQSLDLRHPVGAGLMMVFALSVATTGFWAYGPLILKILFGTKPLVTGYILAGEAIAWSLATMTVSRATAAADRWLIRGGALGVTLGAAGFAIAVPSGSLAALIVCGLLQGAGFGLCWPAIVQRTVRFAHPQEQSLASASVSTVQRIGYAVGTAAVGIAANMSGLAEGVSATAAKTAGFWVFAAFIPVLAMALACAWRFTARVPQNGLTHCPVSHCDASTAE
jgi:MFS family permease